MMMTPKSFIQEKNLILTFYDALESANPHNVMDIISRYTSEDWLWRSFHPFNLQTGAEAVANRFWRPFLTAMPNLQRRQDIFFAGANQIDNYQSVWVVSMGHLMGLFDAPFVGIQPTNKLAFLRYCEFSRIEHNQICETAFYFDLPHFMRQAGQPIFKNQPPRSQTPIKQTGQFLVQPGPRTHDGLLFEDAPAHAGEQTLKLINGMITNMQGWQNPLPIEEELALSFADDMLWWGPEGIGATYTIPRYIEQHAGPFRAAFDERSETNHLCRLAEGHYGGFFGWPNFTAMHKGGFMGYPAFNQRSEFRVIDIYRRHGNRLAENWVFIDLLHFFNQAGFGLDWGGA